MTPLLDEMIFSHLTIAFVYFPMKLTFEIFLLQVFEPGLSRTSAAKGIAQDSKILLHLEDYFIQNKSCIPDPRFLQLSYHKNQGMHWPAESPSPWYVSPRVEHLAGVLPSHLPKQAERGPLKQQNQVLGAKIQAYRQKHGCSMSINPLDECKCHEIAR